MANYFSWRAGLGFGWRCRARLVGQSAGALVLGALVLGGRVGCGHRVGYCVGGHRVWAEGARHLVRSGFGGFGRRFGVLLLRLGSAGGFGLGLRVICWARRWRVRAAVVAGASWLVAVRCWSRWRWVRGFVAGFRLVASSRGMWSATGFGGGGCGLWRAVALAGCVPLVNRGAWRRWVGRVASSWVIGSVAGLGGGGCGPWWTVLHAGCGAWASSWVRRHHARPGLGFG